MSLYEQLAAIEHRVDQFENAWFATGFALDAATAALSQFLSLDNAVTGRLIEQQAWLAPGSDHV